jgi:peptidoglycan/LPS O-acetylase OafA/YrhL
MIYRQEIDGLRAIAVIPVILFHAGFKSFSGGYVGVDIFFVISGYLITSIILEELRAGRFSLVKFYERRARRILPALFLVMTVCLPFAYALMTPQENTIFAQSILSVTIFASNILFFLTSGYFDTAAELKPLLHTWSLAVEEQYYLLFPLLLMATSRFGEKWLRNALWGLILASLTLAQFLSMNGQGTGFYLLPTRCWELLIGSLVALDCARKSKPNFPRLVLEFFCFFGILLIAFAVFMFDRQVPFPSVYTLVPTLGAAMLIRYSSQQTVVGRILSQRALVGIGLLSYSAYLWHNPIFAFSRLNSLVELTFGQKLLLILLCFLLSFLTWKFVERPFRNRQLFTRAKIYAFAGLGTALFFSIGLFGHFNKGFHGRIETANIQSFANPLKTEIDACLGFSSTEMDGFKYCFFGDLNSSKLSVLYGDSHAESLFSELNVAFTKAQIKGLYVSLRSDFCESRIPWLITERENRIRGFAERCNAKFEKLLSYFQANASSLIVANRWTLRLFPSEGLVDRQAFDNHEGGVELDIHDDLYLAKNKSGNFDFTAESKRRTLASFFSRLGDLKKPIILLYPIPEVGWNVPRAMFLKYKANEPLDVTTSHLRFQQRNRLINSILDEISLPNLTRVRPEAILCDRDVSQRCITSWRGDALYYDDDHLSNTGARLIVNEVMKSMTP